MMDKWKVTVKKLAGLTKAQNSCGNRPPINPMIRAS